MLTWAASWTSPYLEEYRDLLPDLWEFLGEQNLYWNKNQRRAPSIEARLVPTRHQHLCTGRLAEEVIPEPTSLEEFKQCCMRLRRTQNCSWEKMLTS